MNIKSINKLLLTLLVLLFMLSETIIINQSITSILSIFIMLLMCVFNFANYKKLFKKNFIITNILPILLIITNAILIFFCKLSIRNLSVLFNEFFFIIITYLVAIDNHKDITDLIKYVIGFNLVLNIISILVGYLSLYNVSNLNLAFSNENFVGIYTNPNGLGVSTCICLILYLSYFFSKKNLYSYFILIFDIFIIYFSGCRTALLVIPMYVLIYIIFKLLPKYHKVFIWIMGISMFMILFSYYGYMYLNRDEAYLNKYEVKLDSILTYRYKLSKYSLLSLKDDILIGIDYSLTAEKRFKEIPDTIKKEMAYSEISLISSNNNNHNSYTQILANQGAIILVLFLLTIVHGLLKTKDKNIPIIITILIISFFESKLLIQKSFVTLLLMFLLADRKELS